MGWRKLTKSDPCPICNKTRCLVTEDGARVLCWRESEGRYRAAKNGSLFKVGVDKDWIPDRRPEQVTIEIPPSWTRKARTCFEGTRQGARQRLADELGVPVGALERQWVGWSERQPGWVWPMWWASGPRSLRCVGGRVRGRGGKKWAVKGSKAGLFLPRDFHEAREIAPFLVICEGATDSAAALGMGFLSIGLPSAGAQLSQAAKLASDTPVVVVADPGPAGQQSAKRLMSLLPIYRSPAALVTPPNGMDLRQWSTSPGCSAHIRELASMVGAA